MLQHIARFVPCHDDGGTFSGSDRSTNQFHERLVALHGELVRLARYEDFYPALEALSGQRVSVDPDFSPVAVHQALAKAKAIVRDDRDPTQLPKQIRSRSTAFSPGCIFAAAMR